MKTRSVRMTDINIGQTFKTQKGQSLQRVSLKGSHANDFYILDPRTFVIEKLTVGQAWDTTVQLDIPSRWTANYPYNGSYFLNDDPNYGPKIWTLHFNHTQNHWVLKNQDLGWINSAKLSGFDEVEDWANKIVDEIESSKNRQSESLDGDFLP